MYLFPAERSLSQQHAAQCAAEQAASSLAQAATSRAEELASRVAGLERELDSLGAELAHMHQRLGRGEFNPATTRVLHLANNPEAQLHKVRRL